MFNEKKVWISTSIYNFFLGLSSSAYLIDPGLIINILFFADDSVLKISISSAFQSLSEIRYYCVMSSNIIERGP